MRTILIDVDTQHDFCHPTGALFVQGAGGSTRRSGSSRPGGSRWGRRSSAPSTPTPSTPGSSPTRRSPAPAASDFGQLVAETTQVFAADGSARTPARTVRSGYDLAGKRVWMHQPSGCQTTYTYADEAILTGAQRTIPAGTVQPLFSVGLDADYRLPVTEQRWGTAAPLTRSFVGTEHSGLGSQRIG